MDDKTLAPQSDARRKKYLNCHSVISRKARKLGEAGGHFHDMTRALLRMQKGRLYAAQFSSLQECAEREWQIPAKLSKLLIDYARTHTRDEAQAAGVLPVPVLRQILDDLPEAARLPAQRVLDGAQLGVLDQKAAQRAAEEARAAGHDEGTVKAVRAAMIKELTEARQAREREREAERERLMPRRFAKVLWVQEARPGAAAAQVKHEHRSPVRSTSSSKQVATTSPRPATRRRSAPPSCTATTSPSIWAARAAPRSIRRNPMQRPPPNSLMWPRYIAPPRRMR